MNSVSLMNIFAGAPSETGENYRLYRQSTEIGSGEAAIFELLPGLTLCRLELEASHFLPPPSESAGVLELSHCLEGRVECRMSDGCHQFVGEGDLFLNPIQNRSRRIDLPLGRYRGIVILLDLERAGPEVTRLLPGLAPDLKLLTERFFCGETSCDKCFLISAREELSHIFSGMYEIPTALAPDYLRLKALELLIFLWRFEPAGEKQIGLYTRQQVDAAKQVHKLLTGDPARRYTIDELAQRFCISATALKTHFKGVYGQSLASYMKDFRIRYAAKLLLTTDLSIAETGRAVGYESQSKFSAEFKKLLHLSPAEYRKQKTGR